MPRSKKTPMRKTQPQPQSQPQPQAHSQTPHSNTPSFTGAVSQGVGLGVGAAAGNSLANVLFGQMGQQRATEDSPVDFCDLVNQRYYECVAKNGEEAFECQDIKSFFVTARCVMKPPPNSNI